MKRPEEVKKDFCRQWIEKGDGDLKACRRLLAGGPEALAVRAEVVKRLPVAILL